MINLVAACFFAASGEVIWSLVLVDGPGQPARRVCRRQAREQDQAVAAARALSSPTARSWPLYYLVDSVAATASSSLIAAG